MPSLAMAALAQTLRQAAAQLQTAPAPQMAQSGVMPGAAHVGPGVFTAQTAAAMLQGQSMPAGGVRAHTALPGANLATGAQAVPGGQPMPASMASAANAAAASAPSTASPSTIPAAFSAQSTAATASANPAAATMANAQAATQSAAQTAASQAAAALQTTPVVNPQQAALLQAAGNPQAAHSATAAAQAVTQAPVPTVAASGNPMAAGAPAHGRGEGTAPAHGHTVAAAARRPKAGRADSGFNRLLAGILPGHTAARGRDHSVEEQADRMFQRLYWLLALTAYVSLAFTVVLLLPLLVGGGTTLIPTGSQRSLAGLLGFAALGFGAGVGAWLLARRGR